MSPDTSKRMTVAEAAAVLGISQDAVRKRIKRDRIRYEHGPDGRVYVYLDTSQTTQDTGQRRVQDHTAELIATLQEQLAAERRANEENRRIIAALTQRIPEIEAPQGTPPEGPGSPTEATEQPGRVEPQGQVEAAQEAGERVSWWRRMFGG